MRIWYIPVTNKRAIVYCQKLAKPNIGNKITLEEKINNKVKKTWIDWRSSDKQWKKNIVYWVDKGIGSIPYEEWCLRTIPSEKQVFKIESKITKWEVMYPSSIISDKNVFINLNKLGPSKIAYHRKWMLISLISSAFTLPIAILPVIPNIPGFYLLFRSYCHYRALCGALHLKSLLNSNLLQGSRNKELDKIYTSILNEKASVAVRKAQLDKTKRDLINSFTEKINNTNTIQKELHTGEHILLTNNVISSLVKAIGDKDVRDHLELAVRQIDEGLERIKREAEKNETEKNETEKNK